MYAHAHTTECSAVFACSFIFLITFSTKQLLPIGDVIIGDADVNIEHAITESVHQDQQLCGRGSDTLYSIHTGKVQANTHTRKG